jgi:hypothetical protein
MHGLVIEVDVEEDQGTEDIQTGTHGVAESERMEELR